MVCGPSLDGRGYTTRIGEHTRNAEPVVKALFETRILSPGDFVSVECLRPYRAIAGADIQDCQRGRLHADQYPIAAFPAP